MRCLRTLTLPTRTIATRMGNHGIYTTTRIQRPKRTSITRRSKPRSTRYQIIIAATDITHPSENLQFYAMLVCGGDRQRMLMALPPLRG